LVLAGIPISNPSEHFLMGVCRSYGWCSHSR